MDEIKAHFVLIDGRLIESCAGGGHRIYSTAIDGFSCTSLFDGIVGPALPGFTRLFCSNGDALPLGEQLGLGSAQLASGQRAIDRYVAMIPFDWRRVAGPFGDLQFHVLRSISIEPVFKSFLETELETVGPGYVGACLALGGNKLSNLAEGNELLFDIMYRRREHVFSKLFGRKISPVFPRRLIRLDVKDIRSIDMWRLLDLFNDQEKLPILTSATRMTSRFILHVAKLPSSLASREILLSLNEISPVCSEFGLFFPRHVLEAGADKHLAITRSVKGKCIGSTLDRMLEWSDELRPPVQFSEPPIPETACLAPITDSLQLYREGKKMAHCVFDYVDRVLAGQKYFYRWLDTPRATIELIRGRGTQWALGAQRGCSNKPLDLRSQSRIERYVAKELFKLEHGDDGLNNFWMISKPVL